MLKHCTAHLVYFLISFNYCKIIRLLVTPRYLTRNNLLVKANHPTTNPKCVIFDEGAALINGGEYVFNVLYNKLYVLFSKMMIK